MNERHHDISLAVGGGQRWMSYRELADARGISVASATRLVLRRKWPRQPGNDGSTRVAVPLSEIEPSSRHADDVIPSSSLTSAPDVTPDISRVVSGFEAALAVLSEQLAAERSRADAAEQRVVDTVTMVIAAQTEAESEKRRADKAEARAVATEAEAARLREADKARRARGVLARIGAALRGE